MPLDWGFQSGKAAGEMHTATLHKMAVEEQAGIIKNKQATTELAQNEAFLQAMKDGKVGGQDANPADAGTVLSNLGMLALGTGNIDKGEKLLTASSTIENQQSLVARRQAKTAYENLSTMSNLFGGVHDKISWDRANNQYQLLTGQPSPFMGQPYSQQLVDQARASTQTAKDKAATSLAETRQKLVDAQVKTEENRRKLVDAQTRNNEARTAAIKKAGGKPVPSQYITAVTAELKDRFEDAGDRNMQAMALPLAEQVYSKVTDEGLTMSEAVTSVVEEAESAGNLGGLTPIGEYSPGSHRDTPLALPVDKSGKIDPKGMKKNQYYQGPNPGETILYTKDGRLLLLGPGEEPPDDAEAGDDEDDVDEE